MVAQALALALLRAPLANGAAGDLDTAFGTGGVVLTQLGQGAMPSSTAVTALRQPDGRLVVSGAATDAGGQGAAALARYLPSGAFDPGFGTGGSGVVVSQLGAGATPTSVFLFSGLALQGDGRIIACGSASDAAGRDAGLVARFTAAGILDPSFAAGGKFVMQFGQGATPSSRIFGCMAQPDGTTLAAGGHSDAATGSQAFLIRLGVGGILDPTFGTGGLFSQQLGAGAMPTSIAADMVPQADGGIVFSLVATDALGNGSMAIARLAAGGASLDPTFGSGGLTTTSFGGPSPSSEGVHIALQPGGKFIVSGDGDDTMGNPAFLAARYTSTGTLDSSFGAGGRLVSQISAAAVPSSTAIGQVLQPSGKVVLLGSALDVGGTTPLAIARYLPDGAFDPSFGGTGVVQRQFGTGATATSSLLGGAFIPEGRLIAVGAAGTSPSAASWLVASFVADTPPTAAFGFTPAAPAVGDAVSLDASASSDAEGAIAGFAWDLDGDGGFDDASGPTASVSFTTAGAHTVGVLVTDGEGLQASTTNDIPVGCGQAQSFLSVGCRLAALGASVDAGVAAGTLHDKLAALVASARTLTDQASGLGSGKPQKRTLAKARRALARFLAKVGKAKRTIASPLRNELLGTARELRTALKGLATA